MHTGNYVVPPAPTPSAGEPLTLVSPLGNLYLTVDDERVAGQLLHDVYDEWDDHRQPTVSWCFSFMMLLMLMMLVQSSMQVPGAGGGDGGSGSSLGPAGGGSGAAGGAGGAGGSSIDPSAAAVGTAAAGLLAGFALVVVWVVSKLFLVVLPLVMVMRLAARAQVGQLLITMAAGKGACVLRRQWLCRLTACMVVWTMFLLLWCAGRALQCMGRRLLLFILPTCTHNQHVL